ncbi:MAG: hypothetical protein JWR61_5619 [Ferruginibacter sp.]|uniref:DUF5602 domain-containing protein n=1 Tax=Ferruginibacter sp. TaxID=1940288 RepID=UPI00265A4591|nr:DUF5602 domain-containing protein [Ferruginibacter sp.]MDB5280664.1 hypothetical protein [Ferruginibacter sp.]
MKKVNRLHCLVVMLSLLSFTACQKEKKDPGVQQQIDLNPSEKVTLPSANTLSSREIPNDYNTFYGAEVQMGSGHARTWINISRTGDVPLAMGIEFIATALDKLPTDALDFSASTFNLKLHPKAKEVTPFDHITVNWEPAGHEPAGVYDVPHFDMHFYKISVAEQMQITGMPTAAPSPGYLPASYVIQGATVPQMGTHWLDPASPELPPTFTPFTHTLIYGSNNGQVIFLEPMITRAFLLSGNLFSTSFPQPTHFSPSGTNYPTGYKIWKNADNGRHYVALTDFVLR